MRQKRDRKKAAIENERQAQALRLDAWGGAAASVPMQIEGQSFASSTQQVASPLFVTEINNSGEKKEENGERKETQTEENAKKEKSEKESISAAQENRKDNLSEKKVFIFDEADVLALGETGSSLDDVRVLRVLSYAEAITNFSPFITLPA